MSFSDMFKGTTDLTGKKCFNRDTTVSLKSKTSEGMVSARPCLHPPPPPPPPPFPVASCGTLFVTSKVLELGAARARVRP